MRRKSTKESTAGLEQALSRRERQIMDILFSAGRATGAEILEKLPDEPSYSTVRTILRILERKGYVRHVEEGLRYVYLPRVRTEDVRRSAMQRLVKTFFDGSAKGAAAAFLDPAAFRMTRQELDELAEMIERARKEAKS
ncbi:MAG: BlaI/MecI/CopY family transcriptional regulator [Acidobacteriaceae bacterium]|nr:BlaI/MecI/CopY family transcriptional regulator [Acidobacteriaceae bacterium]MBV8570347.1 BlaI/MecI/CopY family transcriptional regulator [Acidobacteriaceae bacterium]